MYDAKFSKYMDNGQLVVESYRELQNKNYAFLFEKNNDKKGFVKFEYLPNDEVIKNLYVEIIGSFCGGSFLSSLSISVILLEYMSKREYMKITGLNDYPNDKEWCIIMKFLKEYFKETVKDDEKIKCLNLVDEIRSKIRNSVGHGDFLKLSITLGDEFEIDLFSKSQCLLEKLQKTPEDRLTKEEKEKLKQWDQILEKHQNEPLEMIEEVKDFLESPAKITKKSCFGKLSKISAECILVINFFLVNFYIEK